MQLRMHDALSSPFHGMHPAGVPKPGLAAAWLQQLEAARSIAPAPAQQGSAGPVPARRQAPAGLEPCGVPQGPAVPLPVAVDALPPAAPAEAADAAPLHPQDAQRAERSPLRVHLDPRPGEGISVWLGVDGNAAAMQRAAAAVAGLRQALQASHHHLVSLVCNGMTLYTAGAPPLVRSPRSASPSSTPLKDLP